MALSGSEFLWQQFANFYLESGREEVQLMKLNRLAAALDVRHGRAGQSDFRRELRLRKVPSAALIG
jgi:hypothetical protein